MTRTWRAISRTVSTTSTVVSSRPTLTITACARCTPATCSSSSLEALPCRPMKPFSAARATSSRSASMTTTCSGAQPRSSSSPAAIEPLSP